MKTLKILFLVVLSSAFLFSCEGDEGPQGEQGEQGETGPQGVSGNANVVMYLYGTKTFSYSTDYHMTNMTQGRIDSCIVLAYYGFKAGVGGLDFHWFAVPGIGYMAQYQTVNYWVRFGQYCDMEVCLKTLAGANYTTSVTWEKFKIYVVSPSVIYNGKGTPMDLSTPGDLDEYLNTHKE